MFKRRWAVLVALVIAGLVLAACGAAGDEEAQARIAELETQLEEAAAGGATEAELEELQAQLDEAQAALETAAAGEEFETFEVEFKNPDTLIQMTIAEPETLDPAVNYESAGINVLRSVYDSLIFFKGSSVDEFVPMLATDWEVSDDGMTYTFTIREGVTFHEGGTLEPHDVAYTLQRNLLLGWDFLGGGGPMGLYFDPFFGNIGIGEAGDGGLLDEVGGTDEAVCQAVKDAVVADDDVGTVTMHLAYNATYFPQLVAQPWAGVQDMEWMVEQGAWDGDCATWRDHYLPDVSESTLYSIANGTGPYKLDHWTAGEEVVLTANENWWVTEPLWEGSTIDGVPDIDTVVIKLVEEWGTRLAAVQAGDADMFDHELAFASQVDPMVQDLREGPEGEETVNNPGGILRMYNGLPAAETADFFPNQQIVTEGGNPFIGSGELDGEGIPPDFFSDIHVRKAFNYCFDRDTFIEEVRQGEAIPHRGPIIEGMLGYEEDSFVYEYDLEKCKEEFQQAFDGQLWETGFSIQLAYNAGNDTRRLAAEILRDGLVAVDENENFSVGVVSMPWPSYLAARRGGRLPIHLTGWIEDFHHPHNWVVPYMSCSGDFSRAQAFPEEICAPWDEMIQMAVREDPAEGVELYKQLQAASQEETIDVFIFQPTERHYEQLWVEGWYFHPMYAVEDAYYAGLSKVAPE